MCSAEIITIGNELLSGKTIDSNSAYIGRQFARIGISVIYKSALPDDNRKIISSVKQAWVRSSIIVISGGLGPTIDDITKKAVSGALGLNLVYDSKIEKHIRSLFIKLRRKMPEVNLNQAYKPAGSKILENSWGTAPGLYIKKRNKRLFMIPGVPVEAINIVKHRIVPILSRELNLQKINNEEINIFGIGESRVQQILKDFIIPKGITLAFLPSLGSVKLRLTGNMTKEKLKAISGIIKRKFRNNVYSTGDVSLELALGKVLKKAKYSIAVAESCTGGLLGSTIVSVPGSSGYFSGGFITYSNRAKVKLLGVSQALIKKHGAVSIQVAEKMALGAAKRLSSECGIGITGVAGPSGGTREKPVGTVCIACCCKNKIVSKLFRFYGNRDMVRERSVRTALFQILSLFK
ncbi:MAG: competence/damage-inducible protein A [bacterium]